MGRILTNFQVRASEDDDAAKFEQTVVTKVFPSVSNQFRQDRGPLRCSLYRSRESLDDIHGIILARWGKLTRRYECLIESESHLPADFDSPEGDDLHGLRAPLEGIGTAIDPSSVWDVRGTIPDDATAAVGEGVDPQAVIVHLRKLHDDQAELENALLTALRDVIADTASGEPTFSFARALLRLRRARVLGLPVQGDRFLLRSGTAAVVVGANSGGRRASDERRQVRPHRNSRVERRRTTRAVGQLTDSDDDG